MKYEPRFEIYPLCITTTNILLGIKTFDTNTGAIECHDVVASTCLVVSVVDNVGALSMIDMDIE